MSDIEALFKPALQSRVALKPFTTIQVGGPARYYYQAHTEKQLRQSILWARTREIPLFILGGGSNTLFDDRGFSGLVLHIKTKGQVFKEQNDHIFLTAQAGENWDSLVARAVAQGWSGLECLSGIPGCVGAAPIQNIGAYGQELAHTLDAVRILEIQTGKIYELTNHECALRYRSSIFKRESPGRYIILAVRFRLRQGKPQAVKYPELCEQLSQEPTLKEIREQVLAIRRKKSMIFDRSDPNSHGCGSFFMNPILDEVSYRQFALIAGKGHPSFPAGFKRVKLSAGWLIEHSGFSKGYQYNRAGLSEKHCLAVINRGEATNQEIIALMKRIQQRVFEKFTIRLHPEPIIVPYDLEAELVRGSH